MVYTIYFGSYLLKVTSKKKKGINIRSTVNLKKVRKVKEEWEMD